MILINIIFIRYLVTDPGGNKDDRFDKIDDNSKKYIEKVSRKMTTDKKTLFQVRKVASAGRAHTLDYYMC